MSSAGLTYARGRAGKRAGLEQAAKAKRQKLILAGAGVLLVLVLVIQLPRLLGGGSSAETAVPPPAVAVPAPVTAQTAPAPATSAETRAQIERIQAQYTAKDPFSARPITAGAGGAGVRSAPAGTRDPFALRVGSAGQENVAVVEQAGVRDPFAQRAAAPPPPVAPAPPPQPTVTTSRLRGYTIILVSVPVRAGRPAAVQVAAAARSRGVAGVGVLRSSDYATLRPGYFAVYSSLFETRAEAQRAVGRARAQGYPKAYVRPLGR